MKDILLGFALGSLFWTVVLFSVAALASKKRSGE